MPVPVRLPDGKVLEVAESDTALDVARGISEGLMRAVAVAEVNGALVDATLPLSQFAEGDEPVDLRLVTNRRPGGPRRAAALRRARHGPGGHAIA